MPQTALDHPLHSASYASLEAIPALGKTFLFRDSTHEKRTGRPLGWLESVGVERVFELASSEAHTATFAGQPKLWLRGEAQLGVWMREQVGPELVLDITGLPLRVWAPLLRHALRAEVNVDVLYAEPDEYDFNPLHDPMFDLSTRFGDFTPLPGFERLTAPPPRRQWLIPLLGFEGPRFDAVLREAEAPHHQVVPVVPAPGFRPEYPTYTFQANMGALRSSRSWERVRYANASCPFALLLELESIMRDVPTGDRVVIAPLGTRPHALGALLFHWGRQEAVQIMYDNPVQTPQRTTGISRVHLYRVSEALQAAGCP